MGKIDLLLAYLQNQVPDTYVPAKKLAEVVGVSDRTIRSYMQQLNQQTPNLILSTRAGYQLNTNLKYDSSRESNNEITKRKFYILRKLLQHQEKGVNLFELAEKLYVSDATIRADLASLSRHSKKYHLKLSQSKENYTLNGTEKNKRNMMTDLIKEQNTDGTSFKEDIQKILGTIPIQKVTRISRKAFQDNGCQPNTFFFQNFILHLALAIDRHHLTNKSKGAEQSRQKNGTAANIIDSICEQLQTEFQIELIQQDISELTALCQSELQVDSSNYIDRAVEQILDDALKEIAEVYLLDFSDFQFRQKLLYHVQNLYNRSRQNQASRNFNLMDIKIKYPILFDIAVYLAAFLSQRLSIFINEDEISFLALHIGTFIDHSTHQDKKLKAILVMPNYLTINEKTATILLEQFSSDLIITYIVDDFSHINPKEKVDMVITTFQQSDLPKEQELGPKIVSIKEFPTQNDLAKIRQQVDTIYQEKYAEFLNHTLPILIPPQFYIELDEEVSQELIIDNLTAKFKQEEIVSDDFKTKLIEREKISSTAFPSKIAIPHTIKYSANKTRILVLLPKETMDWNGLEVKLVFGLAVKKEDTHTFNRIFPRMIDIISEEFNVNYLSSSKNYHQFIKRLIDLMLSNGYYNL